MFLAWSQLWMKYSVWRKTKHADEMNFIYAQVKRDKNGLWIDTLQHCILCVGPSWTGLNTMTATYGSTDHRGQRTGGLIPAERLILSEGKLRVVFNDRLSLHKSGPLKKKKKKLHSEVRQYCLQSWGTPNTSKKQKKNQKLLQIMFLMAAAWLMCFLQLKWNEWKHWPLTCFNLLYTLYCEWRHHHHHPHRPLLRAQIKKIKPNKLGLHFLLTSPWWPCTRWLTVSPAPHPNTCGVYTPESTDSNYRTSLSKAWPLQPGFYPVLRERQRLLQSRNKARINAACLGFIVFNGPWAAWARLPEESVQLETKSG